MGSVNFLSVARCTSALRLTQNTCIVGSLASHTYKGASLLVMLRRRRLAVYLLQKNRLKRRRPRQNVQAKARRESASPQPSLLLAGDLHDQGAAESKLSLVEVGPPEEEELADWIGTQPLHEKFDEVVAARGKEIALGLEDGSEDRSHKAAADEKAEEAGSLSSLQKERKLENRKGLMGFKIVTPDVSGSGASQEGKEKAGTRMQDDSESTKELSPADQRGPEETAKSKKGGTQIIRRKGKGEVKRFEAFLGLLPSSVPIPLSETSASAKTLEKQTTKQEQAQGVVNDKPSQKEAENPSEKQTLRKPSKSPAVSKVKRSRLGQPPSAAAPQSREEVAEKVSDFTTRLFRAVTASNSHQDFWDLLREPKPQAEKVTPTLKPASTASQTAEEVSRGFSEVQPTEAKEEALKAPSFEEPVEPQQPNTEVDTQAGFSAQETVLVSPDSVKEGEPTAEVETKTASSISDAESSDATVTESQGPEGDRTEGESTSAEPSFPHWLVGSSSRDTLLVDAEDLAAQIWEGEGPSNEKEKPSRKQEEGQNRLGTESRFVDRGSQRTLPNEAPVLDSGLRDDQRRVEAPADLRMSRGEDVSDASLPGIVPHTESLASQRGSGQRIRSTRDRKRSITAGTFSRGRPIRSLLRLLTKWENPEAKPEAPPPLELNYPERPTFAEIVEGDKRALNSALARTQWWLRSWRVPLQSNYDPEVVDDYFRKRPHLVLGRLFQVVTAFAVVAAPLLPELARARMARKSDAFGRQDEPEERAAVQKAAQRFKRELVGLGPTFIKAAQSLSSRPDIVGEDAAAVLSELQDRLPPFSSAEAMRVIEQELGRPADEVFPELSEAPIAAASFGQVYKGRTKDGELVAVKVQRPRVLASVALDIHILRSMLQAVRKAARINSDLRLLADELGRGLYGELDYRAEAANAEIFASSQAHLPFVAVPRVLHPYSARRVLTMEWVEGDRPVDLLVAAAAGSSSVGGATEALLARTKLLSLVNMGIESSLVQLLETGVMHSDPHPGNLLLRADGKLVYLDFGLITLITRQHQDAMLAAIAHLVNAEWAALTDDLDALDVLKPTNDRREVARALAEAFSGGPQPLITGAGVPRVRFGQVASKLWGIALRFRFKLPPYFTLVLRNLASLEGIGLSADPSFKVFASAYPHVVRKLLIENAPATRRVLRTLLTDGEGGVRWERLSLLASGSAEGSGMSASLRQGGTPPLAARAAKVVFGRKGAGVRRVLLALDLVRIARGFSSPPAAPLRALVAEAAADSLDERLFGPRPNEKVLNGPWQAANMQSGFSGSPVIQAASEHELSDAKETSAARFVVYDPSSRRGDKAVAPALEERLVRKRAWLLVKLIASRLRKSPAQGLTVSWVGLVFALLVARGVSVRAWRRLCIAAQGLVIKMQEGASSEDRLRPMPSFI